MNAIVEMFLAEYFFESAILGRYLDDNKRLFFCLGNLFRIPSGQLDELYLLTCDEDVQDITSVKDFTRVARISKFLHSDIDPTGNSDLGEIVIIKANSLSKANNQNLISTVIESRNILYDKISGSADKGGVDAMRVLGILQCEGIFVDKNLSAGVVNLRKAANWNDLISLVALLNYDKGSMEYNLSRIHMLVRDTQFWGLYEQGAKGLTNFKPKEIKETKILTKAFNSSVLKSCEYAPKYARVLYSSAISLHDKEKAIFNPNKDAISAIADLPLKVAERHMPLDLSWLGDVPLYRKDEQEKIAINLGYNTRSTIYRPLCLCSDSKYLLKMYTRTIQGINSINVERINVGDLVSYDIEPTANNIFVRSVDEDKLNIFLIYVSGDVSDQAYDSIKGFLVAEKRSKFHLSAPNVTINLGNVLPIVLCDKRNMQKLVDVCDVVELADVSQSEISLLVSDIVESKKCEYGIEDIEWSDDITNCLKDMSADDIEKCIDRAIRSERLKADTVRLDRDTFTKYKDIATKLGNIIGFGFRRTGL